MMDRDKDSAQVKFPPPLLLAATILVGGLLHSVLPVHLAHGFSRWIVALILIGGGVAIIVYCAALFKEAGTDIKPWKTTTHLVTDGIYQFSRNPIYLGFVLIGVGFAFAINSLWIALLQIPLVILLNKHVIEKEEAYLEKKFGEKYRAYKADVRRWI